MGILGAEACRLNAPYLKRLILNRPFVTAKWAMTLDGKIATRTGHSRWISGERSRASAHDLRGTMDGILVGVGTAEADDPSLTARPPGPRVATRIVLDPSARLSPDSRLAATAPEVPTLVVVTDLASSGRRGALADRGCSILEHGGGRTIDLDSLLEDLADRGMTHLLVEGGGRTIGGFMDGGHVDAVEIFLAPKIEGGPPEFVPVWGSGHATMDLAARLESVEVEHLDGDLHLRGEFPHPWLQDGLTVAQRKV